MKKIVDMEEWKDIYIEQMELFNRKNHYDAGHRDAIDAVDDWLDAQPDAEKKRGKWIENTDSLPCLTSCSVCRWVNFINTNYCPSCGAKMDLGEEE